MANKFDWKCNFKTTDVPEEVLNGRDIKEFNSDCTKHQTRDGLPLAVTPHATKALYMTNGLDTKMVKIKVELKYGSDEVTGFIGCPYNKDGQVKQFQAKFLLAEEIDVPATAVPILKAAKLARKFKKSNGQEGKEVRYVQRYMVEVVEED